MLTNRCVATSLNHVNYQDEGIHQEIDLGLTNVVITGGYASTTT